MANVQSPVAQNLYRTVIGAVCFAAPICCIFFGRFGVRPLTSGDASDTAPGICSL